MFIFAYGRLLSFYLSSQSSIDLHLTDISLSNIFFYDLVGIDLHYLPKTRGLDCSSVNSSIILWSGMDDILNH